MEDERSREIEGREEVEISLLASGDEGFEERRSETRTSVMGSPGKMKTTASKQGIG